MIEKKTCWISFFLGAALLCFDVPAAHPSPPSPGGPADELRPLVVTGTLSPVRRNRSAFNVSVIDRRQIEASRATSVTELLRHSPGVHIDQPGGRGGVSSVYIRGGDPNYTVVLIDGVKVNDPTNTRGGSFDFSTLNVNNIERIEIAPGPLSAVYGSDSMSGVIHIITRKGKGEPSADFEIEGGSFGFIKGLAGIRGASENFDYSISGLYLDNGEPTDGSGLISKSVTANAGWFITPSMEARAVMRFGASDHESFPDDSGGPKFAVIRSLDEREIDEFSLGLNLNHEPTAFWDYGFEFEIFHKTEETRSPGVAPGVRDPFGIPPNVSDNSFHRYAGTFRNRFNFSKQSNLTFGVEGIIEEGENEGSLDFGFFTIPTQFDLHREILAPFVEIQHQFSWGLFLHAGARLDLPDDFKSEWSPRVGGSYTVKKTGTTVRASWGESFKLPSFFALGHSLVGNPSLTPEEGTSVEAGIVQSILDGNVVFTGTYFRNEFTDAVDFDEGPPPMLVNRSKITAEGFELNLDIRPLPNLSWTGHVTFVDTNIVGTSEELRSRPKWRGGFTLLWDPVPTVHLSLNSITVGEVLDSSIATGDRMLDPYSRLDLAATWEPAPTWSLFGKIDNLLDEDYEEFVGFPAPGISVRVGIRKTIGLGGKEK